MLNLITFIYKGEIKLRGGAFQKFLRLANRFQLKLQDEQDNRKKPKLSVKASMNDLPPEVLTKIFSYLPTFDVLRNIGRVSKKFHDLSQHPRSHINVCLNFIKMEKSLYDFLRKANLMKKLVVNYKRIDEKASIKPMFPDLEKDLERDPTILFSALKKHQHLRSLDFLASGGYCISQGK